MQDQKTVNQTVQQLLDTIVRYPNWPIDGVDFIDIMPIFQNSSLYFYLTDLMKDIICNKYSFDVALLAIESRGFLVAAPVAEAASIPLYCARKPGKLPGQLISRECDNEYGKSQLSIQKGSFTGKNVIIVDDVVATGNTILLCKQLIEEDGGTLEGALALFDLKYIPRLSQFNDINLHTLATFNTPYEYTINQHNEG